MKTSRITSPNLIGLVAPAARETFIDWTFYAGFLIAALAAYIESFCAISDRAKIIQNSAPMLLTIDIGALAAVIAATTIFASLSTRKFRKMVENYDKLVSLFVWTAFLLSSALVVGLFVFFASYVSGIVDTNSYFWALAAGQWLFYFGILQLVDSLSVVAIQMVINGGALPSPGSAAAHTTDSTEL